MKRYLALVLLGLVFLPFFALAENPEWTQYYLPLDRYPPIVFDGQIHEGASTAGRRFDSDRGKSAGDGGICQAYGMVFAKAMAQNGRFPFVQRR